MTYRPSSFPICRPPSGYELASCRRHPQCGKATPRMPSQGTYTPHLHDFHGDGIPIFAHHLRKIRGMLLQFPGYRSRSLERVAPSISQLKRLSIIRMSTSPITTILSALETITQTDIPHLRHQRFDDGDQIPIHLAILRLRSLGRLPLWI